MSYIQQDLVSQARGDTWNLQFLMLDIDGNPIDVTNFQYWFTIKTSPDLLDEDAAIQLGPIALNPARASLGYVDIIVPGVQTNELDPITYHYDLQEVRDDGTISTLIIGKVRIKADITRTADYVGSAVFVTSSAGRALYSGQTETTNPQEIFIGGTQRLFISDEGILIFDALIAGRDNTTGNSCAFKLYGAIKKDTTTTEIIGSVGKTILGEDSPSFDANISADDVNDSLKLEVTAASTNITKWTAEVQYTQVSF